MSEEDAQPETIKAPPRDARSVLVGVLLIAILATILAAVPLSLRKPKSTTPDPAQLQQDTSIASTTSGAPVAKVVVTPVNGLRNGQMVSVAASGFDPGTQVMFMECLPLKGNPNPSAASGSKNGANDPTLSAPPNSELGTCRWPRLSRDAPPTTLVGPTEAATASVDRDHRATASMKVNNELHYLSGLGWHGETIDYLLLGPASCDLMSTDPSGAETSSATTSTTVAANGGVGHGCQIVALGQSNGVFAIRASAPLAFVDVPAPTTTLASVRPR